MQQLKNRTTSFRTFTIISKKKKKLRTSQLFFLNTTKVTAGIRFQKFPKI